MKRARNEFISDIRYMLLRGVISLGLISIVASNGGGGGGGGRLIITLAADFGG